jgi:DNA polymerase-3 subunit gamma/tau
LAERSLSFESALQELASLLHRLSLVQRVPDALGDDDPERAVIEELSGRFSADDLQLYYQIAIQGRADLGLAPDEHAGFTMTLLRMLAFAPATGAGAAAVSRPAIQRAAPAAPVMDSKKNAPDASWQELVAGLSLTGMARMLAEHCELLARDGSRFELRIAQAHQRLLDGPYKDRLEAALGSRLGAKVKLVIRPAESAGASPAAIADRDKQQRQALAIAAIEQDPFVRELVENFDGRVVESTIRPMNGDNER